MCMLALRGIIGALVLALLVTGLVLPSAPHAAANEQAVVPEQGAPGTTFAFFATGFGNQHEVVFWATAPDGTIYGNDTYRTRSTREGRADWQWTAPVDAQPGFWSMVARRLDREDMVQIIPFEIVPFQNVAPLPEAAPDTVTEFQAVEPEIVEQWLQPLPIRLGCRGRRRGARKLTPRSAIDRIDPGGQRDGFGE
ncbi:MAG: hypothetical protein HC876_21065, partial [Chloroflexaceae bacterium]|nr:hypothetical protein [Chloroflexaceae bacterium]